jgi:hypothetical protein
VKRVRTGVLLTVVVLIASVFAFKMRHQLTLTTYKDEQFIVYDCSRSVKAKKGTVSDFVMGGRMDALVPADQNEAKRYCHASGIE